MFCCAVCEGVSLAVPGLCMLVSLFGVLLCLGVFCSGVCDCAVVFELSEGSVDVLALSPVLCLCARVAVVAVFPCGCSVI